MPFALWMLFSGVIWSNLSSAAFVPFWADAARLYQKK
jgi:hypothetical protein